ncbi:taste receptor type 2 member 125-like [Dipodomys merriami]|uniref:taste receptor type 2 member 125-like n=1 Tax=Dipodomys merriami TaxID=94247 RepID=UPI003855ED3F
MDSGILSIIIVVSVEFFLGNMVNGFVALVNGVDLVKRRRISEVDQLLSALALSRIVLLWSVVLNILLSFTYPGRINIHLIRISNFSWIVSNHFNLWLSTNLSFFFFLKIGHFSSSAFLYLKWRVRKVVSTTLVMSLVPLFFNVLVINAIFDESIGGCMRNMSYFHCSKTSTQFSKRILLTNSAFMVLPFIFSLAVILLLIISLRRHQQQMQQVVWGARDASATAHLRALQTGVAFFLLSVAFILSVILQLWTFDFLDMNILILSSLATGIAFPSGHSVILVLGNSKLRQALGAMLRGLRGLWCWGRAPEPRDRAPLTGQASVPLRRLR